MSFFADADAYDRFMGRYSVRLAPRLADFASVETGKRALDVGCGPGALTAELVERLGAESVAAVDPAPSFVQAARVRYPGVEVAAAGAEELPFPDESFDVTLAQLVVAFMSDPVAGLTEMRRVTRRGGVVAACTWDHVGGETPLAPFWRAVEEVDPDGRRGEAAMPGGSEDELGRLFDAAGLSDVVPTALTMTVEHETFEDWWEPFTLGVGPAGQYVARLDPSAAEALRERCRALLGAGPVTIAARIWAARGTA